MSKGTEQLNIRFHFEEDVAEDKLQEMWAQFFDAIGLFGNKTKPSSSKIVPLVNGKRSAIQTTTPAS